ncbi:hypothetical protein Goklo_000008 [Gossypium klotzschianum]|uniref:Reverse transcriptase zinc-binding domain-containing protein n=1 Tax=Gossypium klotzschianum TaxID=34286 RepID=A0A7J8WBJ5_9ROSI|nr:hypothetical protein [Gossypium klotzschianum]
MECLVDCLSQYRVVDVLSCGKPLQEHGPLFEKTFFGFGHDLNCGVCGNVSKDVLHVLRDCSTVRNIWNLLVPHDWLTNFYSSSLQYWLVLNLQSHQDWYVRDVDWKCLFGIIAWYLWKIGLSLFFRG